MILVACQSEKKESDDKTVSLENKYASPKDSQQVFDTVVGVKLVYKDSIINWKGYHKVQETLKLMKKNTTNEVLSLSEQLVENVTLMRDSITVKTLDEKGMRARINALYNQALRLQEMKSIPAITIPEVKKQTQGLFVIFRMINRKANAIYRKQDFEKEMLQEDFIFSKIDSIQ